MNSFGLLRNILLTDEFKEFYNLQPLRIQRKFDYVMQIIGSERVISSKFVKQIVNTKLYEMRECVLDPMNTEVCFSQ